MTCTPANAPALIEVTDLIYSPAVIERRFLTGWWTRGVVPADNFTSTNWAGLIVPQKITFEENEVLIDFPGRHWEDTCPRSMPKVRLSVQYLCKGGRLYLHTSTKYGKNYQQQLYAGHNGARKFSRVPLEKIDEQCSIERTADIPIEQADTIDIRHFADWLATMLAASQSLQVGEPDLNWLSLLADYTETDFTWSPCKGCLFPSQNYSVPPLMNDETMLQLEARLVVQNVKALGELLLINTIPETFNVPLCLHNTYLEVTLPELAAVAHMRTFFSCNNYLEDNYITLPVQPQDITNCFLFPISIDWPDPANANWVQQCSGSEFTSCSLTCGFNSDETSDNIIATPGWYVMRTPGGSTGELSRSPAPRNGKYTVVARLWEVSQSTVWGGYTYRDYGQDVQAMGCIRVESGFAKVIFQQEVDSESDGNDLIYAILSQQVGCGGSLASPSPMPLPAPLPNKNPPGPVQGPNLPGEVFLEAELTYQLRLRTILGEYGFEVGIPIRAKVPQGSIDLGIVNGSMVGTVFTINTQFGGTFTQDLQTVIDGYNAAGKAISEVIPATFGLRNLRTMTP